MGGEPGIKDSLIWFGSRKYWSRAWVTQEVILASEWYLVAGRGAIDWLQASHYPLHLLRSYLDRRRLTVISLWITSCGQTSSTVPPGSTMRPEVERTLLQNMACFFKLSCSGVRGKVYSQSISRDAGNFHVDYEMSVEDLFIDLIRPRLDV